jgi:VanZ family protein
MSRLLAWWPAALWAAIVVTVSSLPRLRVPLLLFRGSDKLAHGAEYALLGLLLVFGLARDPATRGLRRLLAVVIAAAGIAVFGGLDEWHQSWVPGREASVWDWAADVAGGALGAVLGARLWCRGRGASRGTREERG